MPIPPFEILIDQREKLPFRFERPNTRRPDQLGPTVCHLPTGDYSLRGFEAAPQGISLERKSKADLYSTIGQHRARFIRELERLQQCEYATVIVEASWDDVVLNPPLRSQLNPKSLFASIVAWQIRYQVSWHFCESREFAEILAFKLLERFWKEKTESLASL